MTESTITLSLDLVFRSGGRSKGDFLVSVLRRRNKNLLCVCLENKDVMDLLAFRVTATECTSDHDGDDPEHTEEHAYAASCGEEKNPRLANRSVIAIDEGITHQGRMQQRVPPRDRES